MKTIPDIKLSKNELREILLWHKVIEGSEASIYDSNNPYTLYKIFWDYHKKKPMSDNKIEKIKLLYQMDLDYCVKPVSTISYNDMIIGYEMTTDYNLSCYNLYQLNNDELIYYLRKTKDILEYFFSKGIIYGDLADRNILFNKHTSEIKFCDMDNIQIGEYKMDVIPNQLSEYESIRGIDYGVHPYMHNIMSMKPYQSYFKCMSDYDIRKNFYYPARKIIRSMDDPKKFKDKYLIMYKKKNK